MSARTRACKKFGVKATLLSGCLCNRNALVAGPEHGCLRRIKVNGTFSCCSDRTLHFANDPGKAGRAAELRGKLESLSQVPYVRYAPLAYAHDEPGGGEAFFRLMDKAIEERDAGARTLRAMRRFTRFASDPRYDALLEKVGLSDQDVAQAAAVDLAG